MLTELMKPKQTHLQKIQFADCLHVALPQDVHLEKKNEIKKENYETENISAIEHP